MTTAKEKLVARLLEGSHDIFTEFVVVGLEDGLEIICVEVESLLNIKNLNDNQWVDLNELYNNGLAIIQVLKYYTAYEYGPESLLMNKAFYKLVGQVF